MNSSHHRNQDHSREDNQKFQDRKIRIDLNEWPKPRRPHQHSNSANADIEATKDGHAHGRPHADLAIYCCSLIQFVFAILHGQCGLSN